MAIKIKSAGVAGIIPPSGNSVYRQEVEILTDTEAEIKALDDVVDDGDNAVIPTPGSMAYTVDMAVVYQLSPSNKWTKVG